MVYHKELVSPKSRVDYDAFDRCLFSETSLLEEWFLDQYFMERELVIGTEIEFFLLDKHYDPLPENLSFIDLVNQPFLIPEVGAAHLEINTSHFNLYGDCFSDLHKNMLDLWGHCLQEAKARDYHIALIGTLPTATEKFHQLQFITNKPRYHLLNSCLNEQCKGQRMKIHIEGKETLSITPESLAINGLISAFQLHIQVGLSQSVQYYNVAQAIAGIVLAISANSPFLFGHYLWSDTRVASFDQAMTVPLFDRHRGFKCCVFGTNYLCNSFFELFDQNFQFFPRLLPEVFPDLSKELMFHVRRQNGVVYRWNRPVIDFNKELKPHLRIEHRGMPAGPTIIDMVANAAFFYGLLHYFAIQPVPITNLLSFNASRRNFFNAARLGLDAKFKWFADREINALKLLEELLPLAYKGLAALGISPADINLYLGIIKKRIKCKVNGSQWQSGFIEKHGKDFYNMMMCYLENQYQERPVSEWKL
jgi:gamma-glutamyl:cysteine ligase YbdK (ATP-grasp superfamily)